MKTGFICFIESVQDVWASLDENIQATANEVTLKALTKKSAQESKAAQSKNDVKQSQIQQNGTAPPPQTISTQVGSCEI